VRHYWKDVHPWPRTSATTQPPSDRKQNPVLLVNGAVLAVLVVFAVGSLERADRDAKRRVDRIMCEHWDSCD
jgi:hypothetical protein